MLNLRRDTAPRDPKLTTKASGRPQTGHPARRGSVRRLVVIGSGNAACALVSDVMSRYDDIEVIVLERGLPPQVYGERLSLEAWPNDTYAANTIRRVPANINVRSAAIGGGGGSINFTMVHETDAWLSLELGDPPEGFPSWREAKLHLARWLGLEPGNTSISPNAARFLREVGWQFTPSALAAEQVPEFQHSAEPHFSAVRTVFDARGQRRYNGWRATPWSRVRLYPETEVTALRTGRGAWGERRCIALETRHVGSQRRRTFTFDPETTRVVLAAQQQSVRLLWPARRHMESQAAALLGQNVTEHFSEVLFARPCDRAAVSSQAYVPCFWHTRDGFVNLFETDAKAVLRAGLLWLTPWGRPALDRLPFLRKVRDDAPGGVVVASLHTPITGAYTKDGVLQLDDVPRASRALRERILAGVHDGSAQTSWVNRFSGHLLAGVRSTMFHPCGGVIRGRVVDDGYRVRGLHNLFVADSSTLSVPRTSPSMTSYLVGLHAARAIVPGDGASQEPTRVAVVSERDRGLR